MSDSVLYEAPGPRARLRARYASVITGLVLLAVFGWVIYRLAQGGEFTYEKWGPLIDPTNESFTPLWTLLGKGLGNTLLAAGWSILFSLVIGTILALTRVTAAAWYRWAVVGVIELLRGTPVVVLIFFAYQALPVMGLDLPVMWSLVIGLTAYNCVIIAEIVRAGIDSLPKGQSEAAYAVGMRRGQVMFNVLLPQAFRAMLPALISQLVVVLKDTSLGFTISYPEFVQRGETAIENLGNPIQLYLFIALIFIVINYTLSKLAVYTERRLSRGRKSSATAEPESAATTGD
ncbi:glutamate transport system permease protein [Actinopolyspora lacussalsi]|uniref:Glutamate transport system permease protein n=1 Tax=Actinopolyspora righensis TaxID=995060 RepID=A0A1I7AVD8_9ACTN|nr:amino acid ABC transporter permease [Actinopolyspora righensis]MDP9641911.1 glutamate transport system permease protein [Actinopolyspora lacussalsi]SFT78903.1 glutamate transport system permease protein [Actinopolyspora righensis]